MGSPALERVFISVLNELLGKFVNLASLLETYGDHLVLAVGGVRELLLEGVVRVAQRAGQLGERGEHQRLCQSGTLPG